MHKPGEDLLQFIWKHKLLKPLPLVSTSGKPLEVLKPGELNVDAGPDFFNGQVRVNGLVLAGNIEIHVRSSDWLKHGHQNDKNYNNIILHVVYEHDKELDQNKNNQVEVLELKPLILENTLANYYTLLNNKQQLPCATQLNCLNDMRWLAWIERMTIERLEHKVKRIETLFKSCNNDYTQTFFTLLLRNFGFHVNAVPFELLANQLPLSILLKHSNDLKQLEALLFGVSGFLEEQFEDKYLRSLQNEFEYLKAKYQLKPLDKNIFKFSKMRPANFPNVRLAQIAQAIHAHTALFSSPYNYAQYAQIKNVLSVELEGYWKEHYKIEGVKQDIAIKMGAASVDLLIINTFVPFFFFYSKKTGKEEYRNASLHLLEQCTFEKNKKTKLFDAKKHMLKTGAHSQALINLYDNYCTRKACLNCGIATGLLAGK